MMGEYIPQIHQGNGTFLGGYTGYDLHTFWTTVVEGYLQNKGHFTANSDYDWHYGGTTAPYVVVIDKSNMEIIENDFMTIVGKLDELLATCHQMGH